MALKKVNGLWFDENMSDEEIAEAIRNNAARNERADLSEEDRDFGERWGAFDGGAGGEAASDALLDSVFGVEADDSMLESTAKTLGDWFLGSPIRFGAGIGEQIAELRGVEGRDKQWSMDDVYEGALSIPAMRGIKAGAKPLYQGLKRAFTGGLKGPGKTKKILSGLDDVTRRATAPALGAGGRNWKTQLGRKTGLSPTYSPSKKGLAGRGGKLGRFGMGVGALATAAGATWVGNSQRNEKANAKIVNEGETTDGTEKTIEQLEEEMAAKEEEAKKKALEEVRRMHPMHTDPVMGPYLDKWKDARHTLDNLDEDERFNPSLFPNDPTGGVDPAMKWDITPRAFDVPKVGSKKWEANEKAGKPQGRFSNFIAQGQIDRANEWKAKFADRQAKIDQYAPQMKGVEGLDTPADKMKWIMDYNRSGGADQSPATPSNPAQPQPPQATKPAPAPDLDDDDFPWGPTALGAGGAAASYALWKLLTRGKGGKPPMVKRNDKGLDMLTNDMLRGQPPAIPPAISNLRRPTLLQLENKLPAPIRLPGSSSTSIPGGRPLSEVEKFRRASTGMDETTQAAVQAAERAALANQRRIGYGPYPQQVLDLF